MYKALSAIVLVSIMAPTLALAAVTYSRSPSGGSVTSPVAFSVTAASLSDLGIPDGDNYWGLTVLILDGEQIESSCVPTSTLSKIFSVSLPNHNYTHVGIISGDTLANCQNPNVQNSGADLEGPGGVIFTTDARLNLIQQLKIKILELRIELLKLQIKLLLGT